MNSEKLQQLSLNELEFSNLLEKISSFAISETAVNLIRNLKPIDNIEQLQTEHRLIEEIIGIYTSNEEIPISGFADTSFKIEKTKVENSMLSSGEILDVLDSIRIIRKIRLFLKEKYDEFPELSELTSNLFDDRLLEKHISEAIKDDGEIYDNATRELQRIRDKISSTSHKLRSRLRKILRKTVEEDIVQEDFYSIKEGRFVLPVKAENKRVLSGIIHGVSNTGATVFLEPSEIIELNNELSLLQNEENREIAKILLNLTKEIGNNSINIIQSLEKVIFLDTLIGRAKYAIEYGGLKPNIVNEDYLSMKAIRHPLLVHSKGKKNVVPLSIEFKSDKAGHLISGPNAGGKTVALKSIGINLAMALSGIYPLGECTTNFRTIFTSIGDRQSIENDLSTFSSQISQIKDILENCDRHSIVLVDEIGSGTDPQEGAALASGILDTFIEIGLFFIATTHQSSLKTYALNRKEIDNASLEFDEENLKPTYNFLDGSPGNSYAFFLAKNVGLSPLVIKRAKKYLGNKQKELENSISILSKYRSEAIQNRVEAEQEKIKYRDLNEKYEQKLAQITLKREKYIAEAKKEAADIVKDANALIENTIKEVREKQKDFSEIKKKFSKQKENIEKRAEKLEKSNQTEIKKDDTTFQIGDTVRMNDSTNDGIIMSIDDDYKAALVEFGGLKFKTPLKKLKKVKMQEQSKNTQKYESSYDYASFAAIGRIDVRGMRADEAIDKVDMRISEAILSNIEFITVVHGKGTGALREAIQQYLRHHQSVKSFRDGNLTEGGAGVTVVYFS
jgi:DNA mismatch repair protein MutS2